MSEWLSAVSMLLRAMFQTFTVTGSGDLRTSFEQILARQCGFAEVHLRDRSTREPDADEPDIGKEPRKRDKRKGEEPKPPEQPKLPAIVSVVVPWRGGEALLEARLSTGDGGVDRGGAGNCGDGGDRADVGDRSDGGDGNASVEAALRVLRAVVPVAAHVLEADPFISPLNDIAKETTQDMDATSRLIQAAEAATRPPCRLTGRGPVVEKLRAEIERAARTDFTVLVEGETGAGKEMVAHQIHQWSKRRRGPWVAVNCAALVDTLVEAELFGIEDRTATGVRGRRGKIELAHGGTLFLDEVAELSPTVQAKLLRVLQDFTVERVGSHQARRVNARLIVATNRSLAPLVEERAFRSDLFYRVNLLRIQVPPLRERLTDIVELAQGFLAQHQEFGISRISPGALEVMRTYAWPGNVRELFNVLADSLTRAMARASPEIAVSDLPEPLSRPYREVLQPSIERGDTMRAWAARYARLTLERCGNNKAKACERLGISYHTLRSHLKRRAP